MGILQISFIVTALACSVRSKGYGPAIGDVSRNIGGAAGTGIYGGFGGKNMPGMGSYAGTGQSVVGGVEGRTGGGLPLSGTPNYGAGPGGYIGGSIVGLSLRGDQAGSIGGVTKHDMSPKPYNVNYQSRDEQGNIHYKTETGDGSGTVRGKYGYSDFQGLYREVVYAADRNGFKADIRTNEPGVGKDSPADVNMVVEQTPVGIQERYTPVIGKPGSQSGKSIHGGVAMTGMAGRPVSSGYQISTAAPGTAVLGYPSRGLLSGTGLLSGSSGLFAGIKKSSSAKSTY